MLTHNGILLNNDSLPLSPSIRTDSQLHSLLASGDLVSDGVVTRRRDLGLEIHVHQLALFGFPLAVGVAVIDQLVAAGVANLGGRVAEGALGRPLDSVAGRLGD